MAGPERSRQRPKIDERRGGSQRRSHRVQAPPRHHKLARTGSGGIVEVQGTAETIAFSQESFDQLMVLAKKGIGELVALQKLTVA